MSWHVKILAIFGTLLVSLAVSCVNFAVAWHYVIEPELILQFLVGMGNATEPSYMARSLPVGMWFYPACWGLALSLLATWIYAVIHSYRIVVGDVK